MAKSIGVGRLARWFPFLAFSKEGGWFASDGMKWMD